MANNYNSTLQSNNTDLQAILNTINELPEANNGVDLPTLTNEGSASDLLSGKQLIDSEGNIVEGTIVTKTASNLTASGATVTVPAGYYASQTTKSVATATQATPSITINASGLITATATQTAGYVAAGTKSATSQLAFQAAKTITPTTADQVAVSSGYYTGGNITVAAIPSTYVKPSYTKTATTYTPTTTNQTISAGTYCSGAQTIKGDSNLVAGNIKSGVSIFGVNGTYAGSGGSSSGDTSMEDGLVTRTISNYTNNRVANIGNYAFANCSALTTVSFPNATTIGSSAFANCSALTTVSFPNATTISSSAFAYCFNLTTVSFPKVTTIGIRAFASCSSLTTVSFPKVTTIGNSAFTSCSSLTTASFPAATTIGSYAFYSCRNLKSLYLAGSSVCKLTATNAFYSTPIKTSGNIYVPTSLLTSYKKATNWTDFSSRFVGI